MDIKSFFTHVFDDMQGWAVIVLPNGANSPTNDNWFEYPRQLDDMVALVEKHDTGSVWYSPILFNDKKRDKEHSMITHVAAADADTCAPENFRMQPTMVVETSPGRYHVYWKLTAFVDAMGQAKINRRIAQVHKGEGCDTAFVNAAKLLRVPDTSNHKHPGAVVIVADFDDDIKYTPEELNTIYPQSETPDAVEVVDTSMPDDLEAYVEDDKNYQHLLNELPNRISLREMLFGNYHPDKRSEVLFKLCVELYELGFDDKMVTALAWRAPSNKFKDEDKRGIKGLWQTAVMHAKASVFADGDESGDRPDKAYNELDTDESADFLTLEERESIKSEITFIEEWVQWAATKTDAPSEYHEAGAVVLLSTIFSQFGYVQPKFGKLKLNLWMIILGKTTKDRKSTSSSFVRRALHALENDEYNYIIPDDATPGGLNIVLAERENKSSILTRDEVQGFFEEMLNQSYMSGGISYFTKLYDGESGGRARASGEKKLQKSVPISFILFMLGILEDSAAALTTRNYKQGFLTRFLYVIAERDANYVQPPLEFSKEGETEETDEVFADFVKRLGAARNNWSMVAGEKMKKIELSDEAIARFQQFQADATSAAQASRYSDVIDATTERMTLSILKLAALLAMMERKLKIELKHMLQAIRYAGKWFDNSIRVASMISRSEWDREVDALEKLINANGGKISYFEAYRHFGGKQKDFEEILAGLSARGVLIREKVGRGWTLRTEYKEE